ncbi:MAG: HNH endonuclease [Alphaproteobacteria bacterium]|nr:HNH endonuclease [Alphaproteobacteria bacterium]
MASRPTIKGRGTSVAAAFVHAIIPRDADDSAVAQNVERFGFKRGECVYCGSTATDTDHFFALVKGGKPSGYYHSTSNLVPACGPCNQSKGGSDWRSWLVGNAKRSPRRRGVKDLDERISRLDQLAAEITPAQTEAEMIERVGAELWERYWDRLTHLKSLMAEAEKDAARIRYLMAESQSA